MPGPVPMPSSLLKTLAVLATTLVSALISLVLATIVFLWDRHPGEPPLTAVLVGVGSLFIADCCVRRETRTLRKAASIILGAIVALVLLPEVGGRFASRGDELFSMDRLHFGAVSFSVAGGTVGSIAEYLFRSGRWRRKSDGPADAMASDEI